jgi:glycosyltransferase involved in cell wall biosynthesis
LKKVFVAVTNDLATDQRVIKVCKLLAELGCQVTMVGVKKPKSIPFNAATFRTKRFRLPFQNGFLFYAFYNIRLFWYLIFRKADLYVSNDLDTLPAMWIASKLRGTKLVYDSHEYFLGSTEIIHRPIVRLTWKIFEMMIFPGLKHVITVNDSIADIYEKQYRKRPLVVRNLPPKYKVNKKITRLQLGLPEGKRIVLMQGGAINMDRGAEELIHAFKPQYGLADVHLVFIGGGGVWDKIKLLAKELHLTREISFLPKMPYCKMMQYTALCDLGVSIDKPVSPNYLYSLPNKLFDYIAAGIPVLASPLVEVKKVVETHKVGLCIESHEPEHIAEKIKETFENSERYESWKKNTVKAAKKLCWENEVKVLQKLYNEILDNQ